MESCGAELANDAVVPEQLAKLMLHVAQNMETHARWVGTATPEAEREYLGLFRVAEGYRAISKAALDTAASMRSMADSKPAPHDPAQWDRSRFAEWLRQKIELQRAFAKLLLDHAEASGRVLGETVLRP